MPSSEIGTNQSNLSWSDMRLSNLADYAVVIMSAAARHCGGGRVSAGELANETGLPAPTVQKVVSKLTAAGLLRSVRGAGGGLQLARPAAAISVADIVEAVEGPIALTACVDGQDCVVDHNCTVKPHWPVINEALRMALAEISLTSLARIEEMA
jgi:FeS assembly SUF system regulator